MRLLNLFLPLVFINFFVLNSFCQGSTSNTYQGLEDKRMNLYQTEQDYISVELEMLDKGFTFPALVIESTLDGQKTFDFKAFKITPSNSQEIKLNILQGVPNILKVEIYNNVIKATFNSNADQYHIATLFRLLGYNSFLNLN